MKNGPQTASNANKPDVSDGSKADIANRRRRVCSASQSGRLNTIHPNLAADALMGFLDLIPSFCV
jgi:hypothetical protein